MPFFFFPLQTANLFLSHYSPLPIFVEVSVTGRQASKTYNLFQVVLQNTYSRLIADFNSIKKYVTIQKRCEIGNGNFVFGMRYLI